MAYNPIDLGNGPNTPAGDDLYTGSGKLNGMLQELYGELAALQFDGAKTYQTLADLQAVTPVPAEYTPAKVVNDPSESNNGYYSVVSGAWVKDEDYLLNDVDATQLYKGVTGRGIARYAVKKEGFIVPVKNLFNVNDPDFTIDYYLNPADGTLAALSTYSTTGYIPVEPGQYYTIRFLRHVAWYDSQRDFISGEDVVSSQHYATRQAPAGAAYMRLSIPDAYLADYQVEVGQAATSYQAYIEKVAPGFLEVDTEQIKNDAVIEDKTTFFEAAKNLFNVADPDYKVDYWVNPYTGLEGPLVGYHASGYIPVEPSEYYTFSYLRNVSWYDSSKGFISGEDVTNNQFDATRQAPAGAAFMRTSFSNSYFSDYQIEVGQTATAYEAYKRVLKNNLLSVGTSVIINSAVTEDKLAAGAVTEVKLAAGAVTEEKTPFFEVGKNIFNPNDADFVSGEYVEPDNGNTVAFAGYNSSGYIPVTAGQWYTYSFLRHLAYYDNGKNYISGENISPEEYNASRQAPVGVSYVRVSVRDEFLATFQVEAGQTATAYEAYKQQLKGTYIPAEFTPDLPTLEDGLLFVNLNSAGSSWVDSLVDGKLLRKYVRAFPSGSMPFQCTEIHYDGVLHLDSEDEAAPYRVDGGTIGANHSAGAYNLNKVQKMYLDGVEITGSSFSGYGKEFTVVEYYDLDGFNTAGVIAKVVNKYVFNAFGGCTIYADYYAEQAVNFDDIMFVMSTELLQPYSYYMPKVLPFAHEGVNYDFAMKESMAAFSIIDRINITPARCEATGVLADRAVMLGADINQAVGYLPVQDAETARRRVVATDKAMQLSDTEKLYMSAIDPPDGTLMNAGQYYSVIAYKTWFKQQAGTTASYVVPYNGGWYCYYDFHASFSGRLELPNELSGRTFSVFEKTANVEVRSGEIIGGLLVEVTINADYGFLIIKVEK